MIHRRHASVRFLVIIGEREDVFLLLEYTKSCLNSLDSYAHTSLTRLSIKGTQSKSTHLSLLLFGPRQEENFSKAENNVKEKRRPEHQ